MVNEANSHRPHVVLLHSLGASSESWKFVLEALQGKCDVSVPEFPGHGSEDMRPNPSLASWAQVIHEQYFAQRKAPSHVVGVSMGGLVAAVLAARYPQDVESVVIADSFAALRSDVVRRRLETIDQDIADLGMEEFAVKYVDATLRADDNQQARRLLTGAVAGMSPEGYREAARVCFQADVRNDLRNIRQRSAVLVGELDEKTPLALSEAIAAELRHNNVTVIPGSGHLPNLDRPTEFATAIYEVISMGPSRN